MIQLLLIAHELLCLALFWSAFCRSAKAGPDTRLSIKLAVFLLGGAALLGLGAPIYGWLPDWVTVIMLAGFVFMQLVSASLWRGGVPPSFRIGH